MLRVAIFNGFPFHYGVMGYLIHWCQTNGHRLIIYTETRDDYGWFNWYRSRFGLPLNLRPVDSFRQESHNYHLIFLTTDDDGYFKEEWLRFYNISQNIVAIDHIDRNRRPAISKHLKLRYYGPGVPHAYPMYPIDLDLQGQPFISDDFRSVVELPKFDRGIHIYIQGAPIGIYDWETLMELNKSPQVTFHVVSRTIPSEYKRLTQVFFYEKIDALALIGVMYRCHFVFYCLSPQASHLKESCLEAVALAYSCGTPLLINSSVAAVYNFKSSVIYSSSIFNLDHSEIKKRIRAECRERILDLDTEIRALFPNYYLELGTYPSTVNSLDPNYKSLKIPKILHLMWLSPENAPVPDKYLPNLQQYQDYNPDFEFKIWTTETATTFLRQANPRYFEFFESLNLIISRCDFMRIVVLYYWGGIYSDLDFYCLRHLGSLIQDKDLLIFQELPEHQPCFNQLVNGFIGAAPKHPFIEGWLESIIATTTPKLPLVLNDVMNTTGPVAFWRYYDSIPVKPALSDKCDIMPYTNAHILSTACPPGHPFVQTIWNEGSGWGGKDSEEVPVTNMTPQQLALIIFIAILILIIGIVISRIS